MALHKPEHRTWIYWVTWPFMTLLYLSILPFELLWGRYQDADGKGKWRDEEYQDLEDYIDDPIDWLKYKLFGIGSPP